MAAEVLVTYRGNEEGVLLSVGVGETVSEFITIREEIGIRDRDRAVIVQSLNGARINVVGFSEEITSADSFCILPTVFQPSSYYEYYAVSVPREQVIVISDGVQEIATPAEKSAFLIVTTADSTTITLTLTQRVSTDDAEDLAQFGSVINRGETFSLVLDRDQTLYISSVDDLTGSHVVTDKPITFLSGHECGTVPADFVYCDQLIEQLPPTVTWGNEFFMAPFSTRMGSIIVMIASENETNVLINCQSDPELGFEINLPLAGTPANFTTSVFEFCHILSDKPVLLAQFSLGTSTDGVREADPFMVLVPPVMQYLDVLTFRVFESLTGLNETHYINVFLPVQFDRSGFILNGESFSDDLWSPITGVDGGINAYVLQLEITTDTQMASHTDPNARLAVIVYSLEFRTGRGSSAGMMQLPIARM